MRRITLLKNISLLILLTLVGGAAMQVKALPGDLDTSFGTNGVYTDTIPITTTGTGQTTTFTDSKLLADGSLLSFGTYRDYLGQGSYGDYNFDFYLQKLRPNGTLDTSFGTGGTKRIHLWQGRSFSTKMKITSDNKILVAGHCYIYSNFNTNLNYVSGYGSCAMRLMPDGSLDASFGGNQISMYSGAFGDPLRTYTMPAGTVNYNTGGDFGEDSVNGANAIDTTPNGDIILAGETGTQPTAAGNSNYAEVLRLNSSGAFINHTLVNDFVDPTGSVGFPREFDAIGVLSDGKVIAVGTSGNAADQVGYPSRFLMTRIATNGTQETTYENSEVNAQANALSVTFTRSNKILVGGEFGYFGGNGGNRPRLYRFNGDFTPDTTFGTNGVASYCDRNIGVGGCTAGYASNSGANSMIVAAIQPDGKILALMGSHNPNAGSNTLARLNPDGSYDRSFGIYNGQQYPVDIFSHGYLELFNAFGGQTTTSVNLRPNGKIVTAGQISQSKASVSQLLNTSKSGTYSDFNDDGKSEIAVTRNNGATLDWYQLDSFTGVFNGVSFGAGSDKPVPADYDGDGKTDVAVFRPSNGTWYILQSSNNQFRAAQFGATGDIPRPGDFNGDGQADLAVFRPSNGTWYILYSNPIQPGNITFAGVAFGQSGDVPLLGDFDGDGKSDIAVFRNGVWYYLQSSDGQFRGVSFGFGSDLPTVGDYDGDGKSDVAVFRPANGYWYRLNSSTGAFAAVQFGQNGDKPVPADYDNDGKTDLAIFRNGAWYGLRSTDNSVFGVAFGAPTDTPIPAAYLP